MKSRILLLMSFIIGIGLTANAAIIWDITGGTESIGSGDFYDEVNIYNDASVDMGGGQVVNLWTYNTSDFLITDGTISGGMQINNTSLITIQGGSIDSLVVNDSATVNISGGNIAHQLGINSDAEVNYHVLDYEFDDQVDIGGIFSGHWENDSAFSIEFRTQESWETVNVILVPEPLTSSLLLMWLFFIRRK